MRELLFKIEKKDISFLGVLALFAIVNVFRFFDRTLIFHNVPFEIMQQYEFAKITTGVFLIGLFVFYFICLTVCEQINKKNMYYLIMFLSVFIFPMFLNQNYFGTTDVYAWILLFVEVICVISKKHEWITIVLTCIMTYISPVTFFYCECIVLVLLFYRYVQERKSKYIVLFCINTLLGILGVGGKLMQNTLVIDAQKNLSLSQFIAMILCLSPYLYFAFIFFKGLFENIDKSKRICYILLVLGVLPSALINLYIQDFSRVFFYVFTYFIVIVMSLITLNDVDITSQLERVKSRIREWIPIPIMVIVYPLLFITFWVAGPLELMVENF